MNKPVLCEESECTGCEACKNSCSKACIEMRSNEVGFLNPSVKQELCNGCRMCEKSCPVLNKPLLERTAQPTVYACWHKDDAVRMKSSSGGAFSALAESVLAQGGVVFGAGFAGDLHVKHVGIDCWEDLERLRRSKYVQSEIGNTLIEVRQHLENGRKVLFVGTPCQVAGLYGCLDKQHDNLLTADFVCHGVPSPLVFAKYVRWLENKHSSRIKSFNFRDKRKGWQNVIASACFSDGKSVVLKGAENSFYYGFIASIFLRESCYGCLHTTFPRVADFTIADFWGIGRKVKFNHEHEKEKGISLLVLNSEKALDIKGAIDLLMVLEERTLEEAVEGNVHLRKPAQNPQKRARFFQELHSASYDSLARRYFKPSIRGRALQFVKDNFAPDLITKLRTLKSAMRK